MNRIMISGTHSGCGKTTVVCSILQSLVNRGLTTAAFKCGPDYIDPIFHSKIIGAESGNLDSWFCDSNTLNHLIDTACGDVSVIEGVMGFYDGVGNGFSSCSTALAVNAPVVIVIDCKGMSNSTGAVMKGFLEYSKPNNIVGFIFNRLPDSLTDSIKRLCHDMNTEYLGSLPFDKGLSISSRHLGLAADTDISVLKDKMQRLASLAEKSININRLLEISAQWSKPEYTPPAICRLTQRTVRIAIAYDDAFSFLYRDNVEILQRLGCEVVFFSPLTDRCVPIDTHGIILCGGYPELYAERLSANFSMREDIKLKTKSDIPIIAECGGFMYLHDFIRSNDGKEYPMVGALKGSCFDTGRLCRFGYVTLTAAKDNLLCKKGETIKTHEFHYWDSTCGGNGFTAVKASNSASYDCCFSSESLYAGFPHLYLYANLSCAESFVKKCEEYANKNGKS